MTRYNTIILDTEAWDMVIDSYGNIAMAQPPYALAQDVASAVRLFVGELWYDTAKGIPYFEDILGQQPPVSLITGYIEKAALSVPGVVSARCIINSYVSRELAGQLLFIDETGSENGIYF